MFCARCGHALPEGAGFCPNCGAPVTPQGASPIASSEAAGPGGIAGGAAMPAAPTYAPTYASSPPPTPPVATYASTAAGTAQYGGFWRRWLAFIVDGIIIGIVMLPFGVGLGLAHLAAAFSEEMTPERLGSLFAASMFVWFVRVVVSWAYGAGFESSRFQATPGKMLLGMKVTDLEGRQITFLRATGRQLGKWLSGLILCIGYLLVAFSDRKQGLHDMMAGTLVRRT